MKKLLWAILLTASCSTTWAQQIQLNEPPSVSKLVANWASANRQNGRIAGWRIQLLATGDRRQVEEGRDKFKAQFPDIHVDWAHEKPYYKLRAGAFRTKAEAQAMLAQLKALYPGAYPVLDKNILPREFID